MSASGRRQDDLGRLLQDDRPLGARALVGDYVGASGEIGLGVGIGANALIGGSNKTIALQPLSLEASVGVNLALGVARLILR